MQVSPPNHSIVISLCHYITPLYLSITVLSWLVSFQFSCLVKFLLTSDSDTRLTAAVRWWILQCRLQLKYNLKTHRSAASGTTWMKIFSCILFDLSSAFWASTSWKSYLNYVKLISSDLNVWVCDLRCFVSEELQSSGDVCVVTMFTVLCVFRTCRCFCKYDEEKESAQVSSCLLRLVFCFPSGKLWGLTCFLFLRRRHKSSLGPTTKVLSPLRRNMVGCRIQHIWKEGGGHVVWKGTVLDQVIVSRSGAESCPKHSSELNILTEKQPIK